MILGNLLWTEDVRGLKISSVQIIFFFAAHKATKCDGKSNGMLFPCAFLVARLASQKIVVSSEVQLK